jgi:hypothetical protein
VPQGIIPGDFHPTGAILFPPGKSELLSFILVGVKGNSAMRSGDGMMQALRAGAGGARWGHVALLALALQVRSAWLLLGVWVVTGGAGSLPLLGRIRMLPTHPDWVLPALIQSAVVALVVVGLAGRWRPGWALLTAAVASGVAWAVMFAWLPNGLGGYLLVVRPVQEILAMGIVLASVAVAWRHFGRWAAVPVVALAGGAGAGAIRLVLTDTIFGVAWPKEWPRELAGEVVAVAMLAVVVAVLRGTTTATQDRAPSAPGWRSGATLGTLGLLALTITHLVAGGIYSAWTVADSQRLLIAAGLLAVLAGWALVASLRASRPQPV